MAGKGEMKVDIVSCDDWEGIYINGKLAAEGHCLRHMEILDCLGVQCGYHEADQDWMEARGTLPKKLSQVKEL